MTTYDERADDHATEIHRYDRKTLEPASHVVVSAVADSLGCSPLDLEPLYHRVDPDSLDSLVDRSLGRTSGRGDAPEPPDEPSVQFQFAGCRVAVNPTEVRVAVGAAN